MTSYDLVHVHVFHNNQTLHKIEKNPSHRILTRHVSDSTNSLKVANSNVINFYGNFLETAPGSDHLPLKFVSLNPAHTIKVVSDL